MKNLFLLAAMLFGMTATVNSQSVPPYVPANGLVGWWPFNGNANDESGNGNNGVVNGATLTSDRFGNSSMAYSFDGISNYISVRDTNSLQTPAAISINVWVNFSGQGHGRLISKGWNPNGIEVHTETSTDHRIRYGGTFNGNGYGPVSLTDLSDNQWYMVTVVDDGTTKYIYINGVKEDSLTHNYGSIPISSVDLYFGRNSENATDYLNGKLDDVGVWNRVLNQQEISNLYNATVSAACNSLPGNLMNGLVGYWPFCGNANDESGNGNNGFVVKELLSDDRFGIFNSAYSWSSAPDKIVVPDNTSLQLSTSFSIGLWIKPMNNTYGTGPNYHAICEKWGSANDASYLFELFTNGVPAFRTHNSGNDAVIEARGPVSFDVWTHLCYTQSADTGKLYVNGILDTTVTGMLTPMAMNNDLLFGSNDAYNAGWTGDAFEGLIDDIGIWNRALTQQEINQLYNQNICYQTITVTDTLLINVNLTNLNPVTYQNTIKVFPNPTNDHITIDFGPNYASLSGYSIRIDNTMGQVMFTSQVQQQSAYIDLNTWTGVGVYFIYLLDGQGHVIDVRKIVLQ